ncbi:MAG TPA: S8 family peptidase [Herpetosiphonaceae bacterium]
MPKLVRVSLGLGLTLAFALTAFNPAAAAPSTNKVPDQYIVVLKDNVTDVDGVAGKLASAHGLGVLHTYKAALKGFAAKVPPGQLKKLEADPNVASIEQDEIVSLPVETMAKPGNGGPVTQAQTTPTGILRIDGELSSTVSGNGAGSVNVDVAIIDTGIQTNHPDLNVVGGKNCQTGSSYADGHGHGTHVAGTVAAKDDANGVVGVAPGARLWAVRVLNNSGSGTTSSIICGIDWVTANAATIEVANMSLGGSGSNSNCGGLDTYHNAICRSVNAGVTYAVAAGNSAADANNFRPATYPEVITVSALADFNGEPGGGAASTCRADVDDTFADFSNYGADVDIIAPGVCILSTWLGSGYNTISGTSMASPHVAGAAALYKANNPGATPAQVKTAIQNAGNLNWNTATDPDGNPEKLLNVDIF